MNKTEQTHRPHRQETCSLKIYPHGTITDRGHLELSEARIAYNRKRPKSKGRRKSIRIFSKASASRLRRTLAQTEGPDGWLIPGITFTVPGPVITDEAWRRLWRAFIARVRRIDGVAFIWRIEMQERGQPHIHCVCWVENKAKAAQLKYIWLDNLALLGPYEGPADIKLESSITSGKDHGEFKPGWAKVTTRELWPGAYERAVKINWLEEKDESRWWRYLASHASKSKRAQLGWLGRQWGVFNKRLLASAKPTVIVLPRKAMNKVVRWLKRLTNCHHASGHGQQTWFANPETVNRLCEWVLGNSQPLQLAGRVAFSPFKLWKKDRRERAKAKRRELLCKGQKTTVPV